MAREKSVVPKSRLTLEMPETVREQLDLLRQRTSADSVTEVIRRAIAMYDFVVTATERGDEVIIKDHINGVQKNVILVFK